MGKYIVLSARPYDFENNKGERVKGVKISYINKKPSVKEGEFGHPPFLTSISLDSIKGKRLEECPAVFELEFEQVTGKNNKPEIVLTDLEYVAPVDLSLFFQ